MTFQHSRARKRCNKETVISKLTFQGTKGRGKNAATRKLSSINYVLPAHTKTCDVGLKKLKCSKGRRQLSPNESEKEERTFSITIVYVERTTR